MERNSVGQIKRWILILFFVCIIAITISSMLYPYSSPTESAAINNLREVSGAQILFLRVEHGYASTWKELHDDPIAAGKPTYLDIDLSVVVQGYTYTLQPAGKSLVGTNGTTVYTDFTCTAVPVEYKKGSKRSFFVDSTGVIRFEYGKPASIDSEPI